MSLKNYVTKTESNLGKVEEIVISPEKRQEILKELRQVLQNETPKNI